MASLIYIFKSQHNDADISGSGDPMPVPQPSDPSKDFPSELGESLTILGYGGLKLNS